MLSFYRKVAICFFHRRKLTNNSTPKLILIILITCLKEELP